MPKDREKAVQKIAEEAGVSVSTVYNALRGTSVFKAETRKKITELAEKYGYTKRSYKKTTDYSLRTLRITAYMPLRPAYFWEEAIRGMQDAASDCKIADIQLSFSFYSRNPAEEESQRIRAALMRECPDGVIIVPIEGVNFQESFTEFVFRIPTLFFNELPNDSSLLSHSLYVGPDPSGEGRQAAMLLEDIIGGIGTVAILTENYPHEDRTSAERKKSFIRTVLAMKPDLRINEIGLSFTSQTPAAQIARRLSEIYGENPPALIYVTLGYMSIACLAVAKYKKQLKLKGEKHILCLGHELSPSDELLRAQDMIYGCVRQDMYTHGHTALTELVNRILYGETNGKSIIITSETWKMNT